MIDSELREKVGFGLNEEIVIVSAIREGDTVIFERQSDDKAVMRPLRSSEIDEYTGLKFRVNKGEAPGTVDLISI
jgi:bifunctional DNA-binding transcriptional regulator/antitoxin component of YhaV-PrlF toxin-antitoxin module